MPSDAQIVRAGIWNGEGGDHGVTDDKGFEHDDRQACCRYTSTHNPINCNAARNKYTEDYLSITQCGYHGSCGREVNGWANNDGLGSQGYDAAWAHYSQTGKSAGYIWHSDLCNPDGTDIIVTQDCSLHVNKDGGWGSGAAECGNVHGIAYFAVDNGYDFWVNDQLVGSGNDWTTTDRHTFEASCDENTVYGIDAYDEGGIASILGTIYHCDEMILTSNAWKCNPRCEDTSQTIGCTNTAAWTAPNGNGFDDWYWPSAATAGDNGALPWGHRPDVSGEAHWIWSHDSVSQQYAVWVAFFARCQRYCC